MSHSTRGALVPALFVVTALLSATDASAQSQKTSAPSADTLHMIVAPQGNTARYRVREQLAGFDFPNDAVGETSDINGVIVIGPNGKFISSSRIEVNVAGLKSDKDRRDNYLRGRTLETEQHPVVTIVPTEVKGLPATLPTSGKHTIELLANLTVKGVTRPTVWRGEARFANGAITGTVATSFKFEEFGLTKPSVRSVLSVDDDIKLEYDFMFVPAAAN